MYREKKNTYLPVVARWRQYAGAEGVPPITIVVIGLQLRLFTEREPND